MCEAFNDGRLRSVMASIRHGVTTLSPIVLGKSFSQHPALSGLTRSFPKQRPAHKPYIERSWHISQLLTYIDNLDINNNLLSYDVLIGKFVCLCMMLSGMRLAEIARLDIWSAEPTSEYWQTHTNIKKHDALSLVRLPRVSQKQSLDPVLTLLAIRERHLALARPAGATEEVAVVASSKILPLTAPGTERLGLPMVS
jgi:hypothetical protein